VPQCEARQCSERGKTEHSLKSKQEKKNQLSIFFSLVRWQARTYFAVKKIVQIIFLQRSVLPEQIELSLKLD
jgi:hypothetical protein